MPQLDFYTYASEINSILLILLLSFFFFFKVLSAWIRVIELREVYIKDTSNSSSKITFLSNIYVFFYKFYKTLLSVITLK